MVTASAVVECIIPILKVSNLVASVRYYTEVLGFHLDWQEGEPPTMASVSRDSHAIMLCKGCQGQPGTWVWIGVDDIAPLSDEYRRRGVHFQQPPTNYRWAYEMQIKDPDGHVLRFGSEPRPELRPTDAV
jgi:predicted lactoylglutathione lyase